MKGEFESDFIPVKCSGVISESIKDNLIIMADKLYKLIFQSRRDGLNQFGEGATNNIVFKVLRRSGHLEALRNLKFNIYDELETI